MDGSELDSYIEKTLGDRVRYIGVFTSDEVGMMRIYSNRSTPIVFIANTLKKSDDSNIMGHWVCFYIEKSPVNKVIYFDSYGLNPMLHCEGFELFILQNTQFTINNICMQMQPLDSYKCGLYVIFFIHYTSLYGIGETLLKIEHTFSPNNQSDNDRYVTRYFLTFISRKSCAPWRTSGRRAITYRECLAARGNI